VSHTSRSYIDLKIFVYYLFIYLLISTIYLFLFVSFICLFFFFLCLLFLPFILLFLVYLTYFAASTKYVGLGCIVRLIDYVSGKKLVNPDQLEILVSLVKKCLGCIGDSKKILDFQNKPVSILEFFLILACLIL
jgi:hypothetical protein